ncbi:MAG TPA: 50S ribosomal protein L21 [Desulfohalobiaceae bacterium]|nr:50S ribosomal protein L21 [Desulfohalobiaceae bacterium]
MYAVVASGGKQYRINEGDVVDVEKLQAVPGEEVVIDSILLANDDSGQIQVGTPFLNGTVICEVLEQFRGQKQIIFKHKKRKGYRKKAGHRQNYTKIKIKSIELERSN